MNRLSSPELTILRKPTGMSGPVGPHAVEDSPLSPVRIGIGAVSRHPPSFVQLYYAIEARRTTAMPLAIQFASPSPGGGASTIASGYARVAADDCAQPVLYIDCNAAGPVRRRGKQDPSAPSLADTLRRGVSLSEAIQPVRDTRNLLWARLASGDRPLLALGGDRLQALLDMLRASHPVIVLDTPPTDVPEAAAVSRFCDGTVLVVEAGKTRQWEIENAKALIERLGGQPVGAVLNRERTLLPRWMGGR
ncbi:MAG TPA: CpsD/CapB family tyrosine-protein kinase [Rhodopila sp.]|uniref:CpsD/CapB family tyrosine-protein kinase n=1 Tax=Rhodopila sp. TaxID=2480087 RepID=UPI002CEF7E38|nr:CpsD/CapB family tyrosine-protein kinase [Rhodopila sp.]HVY15002.1 CpsD/CapB family tyrosine-protein kinase [Rhodopila sp.]